MSSKSKQPFRTIKNSGLDILFGDNSPTENSLDIKLIQLPPEQPRRYFDPQKMAQLIESVKSHGIIEPLLVRPIEEMYELVAGERRYRAAIELQLTHVPVIIRELSDQEALQLALIENLHREDLNPVEETEGILQLIALRINKSSSEVVQLLRKMKNELEGKVRHNVIPNSEKQKITEVFQGLNLMTWESFVKNRLPLLNLPKEIKAVLVQGKIAYTKAVSLSKIKDEKQRKQLLKEVLEQNLSVREIKARVKELTKGDTKETASAKIDSTLRQIKKQKLWENEPKKWQKVEKLLDKINLLLDDPQ